MPTNSPVNRLNRTVPSIRTPTTGGTGDNGIIQRSVDNDDLYPLTEQLEARETSIENSAPFTEKNVEMALREVSGDLDTIESEIDALQEKDPYYITVAGEGGDFTSIKAALDSITDSGLNTPYTVFVQPGIYLEAPMTVPRYVTVSAAGGVIVTASNNNQPLFTLTDNNIINRLTVRGPSAHASFYSTTGTSLGIENCQIYSGLYGVWAADGGRIIVEECKGFSPCSVLLYATNAGRIDCSNILSFSPTSFRADGAGTEMWIHNSGAENTTTGIYATNGALVRPFTVTFNTVVYSIRASGASTVDGGGIFTQGTTTYDIWQEDSNSVINIAGGIMHSDDFQVANWSNVTIYYRDDKTDDEGLTVSQELHVGSPEKGYEAVIGEGDSYTRGMLVYTYDGANYVDVSTAARSATGSTFTFPNLNVNTAIYVASSLTDGSDYLIHYGIKPKVVTACVPGAGEIVAEYWSGAAWTEFNTMSTDADSPYLPHAKDLFQRGNQSDQVRYNCDSIPSFAKTDPMTLGTDYYWIRYRIKTAAITTAPVFEQWKLHTNRTEMNADGWVEYFGNARPLGVIPWDIGLFEAFQSSPGNQDLYTLTGLASNRLELGRGGKENEFVNGNLDLQGLCAYIPFDADTSCPIKLRFSYIANSATGTVEWFVNWGFTSDGDTVSDTAGGAPATIKGEGHTTTTQAIAASDTQYTSEVELDISEILSRRAAGSFGDLLWISIARDASGTRVNDNIAGNITLIQITPIYTKWTEGGHI